MTFEEIEANNARIARLLDKAHNLPEVPGCYLMKDSAGKEIYVGKAKDLRRRVCSYFQRRDKIAKDAALVDNIEDFDWIETESEVEAFLLENRLIKDLQPKYNMMLKNNEAYPWIEVTLGEDFPRILLVRKTGNKKSRYFGPYVSGSDAKVCVYAMQRIFKIRTCARVMEEGKRLNEGRSCLNWHLGLCSGVCRGRCPKQDYRKRVLAMCRFLDGGKKDLLTELRREMQEAVTKLHFETAAQLRDMTQALENIHSQPAIDPSLAPPPPQYSPEDSLLSLQDALGLTWLPRRIEGVDIANLQGKETVGSLVYFIDGMPFKDGYRRYRIKTVEGQDDFASISEVVRRRYQALSESEAADILLIDGGKGQLHAAWDALQNCQVKPGILLSLAKGEETLFRCGDEQPVAITKRNAGLKLLMYIRDESHRFAQHYHHILRRRAMFNE